MSEVILLRPRLRQGGAQPEASQAATPPKRCTPLGAGREGALNPSNRWQRLFVASTTFPGVPRPHRCRIKDMHHCQDGQERGRSPGERRLQGARIALPPPEQIPPSRSLIAVSSKLPQVTGHPGEESLGQRNWFSLA